MTVLSGQLERFDLDTRTLGRYFWAAAALGVAVLIYLLFAKPPRYLYMALAAPLAMIVVTHPRLALYQFIGVLFIEYLVVPSVPIFLIDLSMLLVIAAGLLDFLTRGSWPRRLPPMSLNYGYLVLALAVSGVVGFWPELVVRRVVTTGSLLLLFLAIYRLSSRIAVAELLRVFFFAASVYAVYATIPFILTGGIYRALGLYGVLFDDQAMVALPIGVGLFLGAKRQHAIWYFIGVAIIFVGLLGSQSRAPIGLGLTAAAFVVWVAVRRPADGLAGIGRSRQIRRRAWGLVGGLILLVVVALVMRPDLPTALIARFEELFADDAEGTMVYRMALWKRAILTFLDHPIFGTGPGGFYRLAEIYPSWHLTPNYGYLRILGAHNVLLHYLSDTGLVGGLGLVALVINQFRHARRSWRKTGGDAFAIRLALYGWAFLFVISTLVEANWMWGQLSFMAVFLAALVARQSRQTLA